MARASLVQVPGFQDVPQDPTQDPGSPPTCWQGLYLCHCPATLLPLALGPEQAAPVFLIAPPLVGSWLAPWAPVLTL